MKIEGIADPSLEKDLLSRVQVEDAWEVVEKFNGIVRESGSEGEREAVRILTRKLDSWNVSYKLHTPTLFVSLPRSASLKTLGPDGRVFKAKTPSMSASTAPGSITADLVYLSSGYAKQASDVFAGIKLDDTSSVRGKAVLTEGLPLPARVTDLMEAGAAAVVFISPGERIHEGICTNIWGSPDLDSIYRKPGLPVVSVSKSDGLYLKAKAEAGSVKVEIATELEEGWKPLSVLVAEIKGCVEPDKFILVHGHLDSWHVGISDNATGNATLLELARVLKQFEGKLKRSVRIAWWNGHSHGRYAGSTWYADAFALDLLDNCIAHVNCDSTGTRDADAFEGISIMKEFEGFCQTAIKDAVGADATADRVARAGDCSFSNLGVGTFYMLFTTIPEELRKARGLYHVGGSGGNNEWHHEDDTIEVADKGRLLRDTKAYALSVMRFANAPVLPYNFADAADEILGTIRRYAGLDGSRAGAGTVPVDDRIDLTPAVKEAEAFAAACKRLLAKQAALVGKGIDDPEVKALNGVLMEIDRLVVRLNYVRGDRFRQDPALESKPVPDLAFAEDLAGLEKGSDKYHLTRMQLLRGCNKVVWNLRKARRIAESVL
ncbi:MAG: M28 family peptidase [Bacillota bacterium]